MSIENNSNSFLKQATILAVASIFVRFLGMIYRFPLTNMIGDRGNAIYSAGYYIYTFLLILSSAGLPAAISKLVSERLACGEYNNAHRVFKCSLALSTTTGGFAAIMLFVFGEEIAGFANTPEAYYCILTLSPTLFIVAIMSAFRGYFQGMNNMVPTATSQIVEQVFNGFFSVYLAYVCLGVGVDIALGEKNIELGAAGGTAGTGIGALAGLIIILLSYRRIRPSVLKKVGKDDKGNVESYRSISKDVIFTATPIIAGTAVFSITNLVDMNMVIRLLESINYSHDEALELYGQLSGKYVTLTTLPISLSTALATAIIPSIASSMKRKEFKVVKTKIRQTFRMSMILSVPSAVGIGVLGDQILHLLFPFAPEGGNLLVAGSVSILFLALCQTATGILQGVGRLKIPVIGAILGAITKIILNYLLIRIPAINIMGAIISTTGCYLVASTFNIVMLCRITKVKFDFKGAFIKPIIGSTIMGIVAFVSYKVLFMLVPVLSICTIITILLSIVVYGVVMLKIKGIRKSDLTSMPMGNKIVNILGKFRLI